LFPFFKDAIFSPVLNNQKPQAQTYSLLDSGNGKKFERFGGVTLVRPCAQAVWQPALPAAEWARATAAFDREEGNRWQGRGRLPDSWNIRVDNLAFKLSGTDFGHLGLFPEQREQWKWIEKKIREPGDGSPKSVLNLFAYSGASTLAAAVAGAAVCHLDASRGMVQWARDNAALNQLNNAPIRWIADDAHGFMEREIRRGRAYDAIILDPPTFGRGTQNEVYKIEDDLPKTLSLCLALLSKNPLFVLLSCHTPGFTPVVLHNLLRQSAAGLGGNVESGEMLLEGDAPFPLPSGAYARWSR